MSCPQCLKLEKKIRVLQSDFEFEFRKLSEDKSTEKALFEINVQKEVRKWQEKYTKQRIDHEQNSKKWLQKIDQVTSVCEKRVQQLQAKWQSLLSSAKHHSEKQIAEFKQSTEIKHSTAIKQITEKNHGEVVSKENHYQQIIESLKQEHATTIESLKRISLEKETKLRTEYESFILGLKSEKNVEQRNSFKLQEDFRVEKTKLLSQMYDLKFKITASQEKIQELKRTIQQKQDIILTKEQQLVHLTSSQEEKVSELKNMYERQLLAQQIKMEERIKQFLENQLRITEKYEQSIIKIQQNRQVELEIYRNNMNQIKNCIENRQSRVEDLEEILSLKDRLGKKEKECDALEKELKDFQLELQNKEDTYNKIFIPTINSTHLPGENVIKRKQLKMKRPAGRSVTTVRQILNSVNINSNNLPLLNNLDKKMLLPPKSTKIL